MMLTIHKLPVPVIARVHGMATAAGCQLVAQCDLAVASRRGQLCHQWHPLRPVLRHAQRALVRNVPAKRAMEMLLTGDFIDARTALAQGLVNRVVPAEALDAEVEKLVQSILRKPRTGRGHGQGPRVPAARAGPGSRLPAGGPDHGRQHDGCCRPGGRPCIR